MAICLAHIALGLLNPLLNCPRLHQLLWATQGQQPLPQPDFGHQGIPTDFLHRAKPLHSPQSPRDRVLWAALTMGHYGLFHSSKLAQLKLGYPASSGFRTLHCSFQRANFTMSVSSWPAAKQTISTRAAPSSSDALGHQSMGHVRLGTSYNTISRWGPPWRPHSSKYIAEPWITWL